MGTACSYVFKISFLKTVQPSWTLFPFRTATQGTPPTSLLNNPKSALQKSKETVPLTPLLTFPRIKNSITSWSLRPRRPPTTSPFSVHKQKLQQGTFPSWVTHQLCQEVTFHTLWESPRLLPLCSTAFPADIRKLKSPTRKRAIDNIIYHTKLNLSYET